MPKIIGFLEFEARLRGETYPPSNKKASTSAYCYPTAEIDDVSYAALVFSRYIGGGEITRVMLNHGFVWSSIPGLREHLVNNNSHEYNHDPYVMEVIGNMLDDLRAGMIFSREGARGAGIATLQRHTGVQLAELTAPPTPPPMSWAVDPSGSVAVSAIDIEFLEENEGPDEEYEGENYN